MIFVLIVYVWPRMTASLSPKVSSVVTKAVDVETKTKTEAAGFETEAEAVASETEAKTEAV